jgi:hypothetical protein
MVFTISAALIALTPPTGRRLQKTIEKIRTRHSRETF